MNQKELVESSMAYIDKLIDILIPYVEIILVYNVLLVFWLLLLWLRPLWLLKINSFLDPLEVTLPNWLLGIKLSAAHVLLVSIFRYSPRVLNAWVKSHLPSAKNIFNTERTVIEHQIHINLPVYLNDKDIDKLTPEKLHSAFNTNITHMIIWGEGGVGKTSLACELAQWAMEEDKTKRLCLKHQMLPVLIENDFSSFLDAVSGKVRVLIDAEEKVPEELLIKLLRKRRLLVIVDHFSEMEEQTRATFHPEDKDFPANALIVTSRIKKSLGSVPITVIEPLLIKGNRLSSFMEKYIKAKAKKDIFKDDTDLYHACIGLSKLGGDRDITVLLARLYANQLIAAKTGAVESLPETIPDLMLDYVDRINQGKEAPDLYTLLSITKPLAWACLKKNYYPVPVSLEEVHSLLKKEHVQIALKGALLKNVDIPILKRTSEKESVSENAISQQYEKILLQYCDVKLRLIQKDRLGQVLFTLDPLAEYLAGLYIVEQNDNNDSKWRKFLDDADKMPGAPETIRGFLLAVKDCCLHKDYGKQVPEFVVDEIEKMAGIDPKLAEYRRLRLRIGQLISNLSMPEDTLYAVDALREIGPAAKAATESLSIILNDESQEPNVLWRAAEALGNIGQQAKGAVHSLVSVLTNEDKEVRTKAAEALGQIGPAASSAINALVSVLKNIEEQVEVRVAAIKALGKIGLANDRACRALILATQDKKSEVYQAATWSLTEIGPEIITTVSRALSAEETIERNRIAKVLANIGLEAVPALVKNLNDDKIKEAAWALGEIGGATEFTIDSLVKALEEKDTRKDAVIALGKMGSAAETAIEPLIESLRHEVMQVTPLASVALARIGPGSVKPLTKALGDPELRDGAAVALGEIGPDARIAVEPLIQVLDDDRFGAVFRALTRIGNAAVSVLINGLKDERTQVRAYVASILRSIGPGAAIAVEPLAKILLNKSEDKELRCRAAEALGEIGPASIVCILPSLCKRRWSSEALKETELNTKAAINALHNVYQDADEDDDTHEYTAEALRKISLTAKADIDTLTALLEAENNKEIHERVAGLLDIIGFHTVAAFVVTLHDSDKKVRADSAHLLARVATNATPACETLQKAIQKKDEDDEFRYQSTIALARIASVDKIVIELLVSLLQDKAENEKVRSGAAEGLGYIASNELLPIGEVGSTIKKLPYMLLEVLLDKEEHEVVRKEAAEALEKVGQIAKPIVDACIAVIQDGDENGWEYEMVIELLGDIGFPAANVLGRVFRNKDKEMRIRMGAEQALEKCGLSGVEQFCEVLQDKGANKSIRKDAAWSLGRMETEARAAADVLVQVLLDEDEDIEVSNGAIWALGSIRPETRSAVEAVVKKLKHENYETRKYAVIALGEFGPASIIAIEGLIEILLDKSEEEKVRQSAVWAIGKIGPDAIQAIEPLVSILQDENWNEGTVYYRDRSSFVTWVLGQLASEKPVILDELISILQDPEKATEVRRRAAEVLGESGSASESVIESLIEVLITKEEVLRLTVVQAFGRIGSEAMPAVAMLATVLKDIDEDKNIRIKATEALGLIGPDAKDAVPELLETIEDESMDELLRPMAAFAIGKIGPGAKLAADILGKVIQNAENNEELRYGAIWALGQVGLESRKAVEVLIRVLQSKHNSQRIRSVATSALFQFYYGSDQSSLD